MELLNTALRLFTVSQLLLFGLLMFQSQNPLRVRLLTLMLAVGVISYHILNVVEHTPILFGCCDLLWYPANVTPSLLLLLVWFTFEEKCSVPMWLILVLAFGLLSSLWFNLQGIGLHNSPTWLKVSKVLISLGAIAVVWGGKDNDLVEIRYRVRNLIVFSIGLIMAVIFIVKIATNFNGSVLVASIEAMVLFAFTLLCNYYFIKLYPHFQLVSDKPLIRKHSDDKVIIDLLERMV